MNGLMEIERDKDILKYKNDLISSTAETRRMKLYEDSDDAPGPTLKPMRPNFNFIHGKWNERLFELLASDCERNDDMDHLKTEDDEDDIRGMFFDRIERLRETIKACLPKQGETDRAAQARIAARAEQQRARQRQNTRRQQVGQKTIPS